MAEEKKEAAAVMKQEFTAPAVDIFSSPDTFAGMWKVAVCLSKSQMVPRNFQNRPEDCMIALDMARRIGASPIMILQNLYIVYGKPAWSSQFLISCLNSCGKFSPLRYTMTGKKGADTFGCIAWATDKAGERLESPEITIDIAKKEGWVQKDGSKWKTMPDLMLRYRAATLFARTYAPELTMGMHTVEEEQDIIVSASPVVTESKTNHVLPAEPEEKKPTEEERVQKVIDQLGIPFTVEEVKAYVQKQGEMFIADTVIPNLKKIADRMAEGGQENA